MRSFAEHNPIAQAVYFLCAAGIAMFSMDPAIILLSLTGALALSLLVGGLRGWRTHLAALTLFLVMALVNPLVSHRGVTVLFVMNHNPVTLEALLYGLSAAGMIVAVLYWFRAFSRLMTTDRLLYLFGALSPKLALLLSMTLRYVPLFEAQTRRVHQAQKAMGLFREDSLISDLRGRLQIFSVMTTWALENGVITADSMTARGYEIGRRSRFAIFRFTLWDGLLTILSLLLAGGAIWGISARSIVYYPAFAASPLTPQALAGYCAYGLLVLLPLIIDGKEALRWRCLRSTI